MWCLSARPRGAEWLNRAKMQLQDHASTISRCISDMSFSLQVPDNKFTQKGMCSPIRRRIQKVLIFTLEQVIGHVSDGQMKITKLSLRTFDMIVWQTTFFRDYQLKCAFESWLSQFPDGSTYSISFLSSTKPRGKSEKCLTVLNQIDLRLRVGEQNMNWVHDKYDPFNGWTSLFLMLLTRPTASIDPIDSLSLQNTLE